MFLQKWQSEVVRVFSRDRIAKNLVAVICLSFIQTLGVPVIGPGAGLSKSSASTFDSSGLIVNWDASNASSYTGQGATTFNDLSGNSTNGTLTLVGSASLPTYTNTRPTYLKLGKDSVYTNNYYFVQSGDLKSKLDATSSDSMQNISIFTWVYPTANGIIVDETNNNYVWQDSQIEMVNGKFIFRVWNSAPLESNVTTPMSNWYYVGLVYNFSAKTLTGYVNGNQVGQLTGLDRLAPWEFSASNGVYYSVGRYDPTNLGSGSGGNFRFGALHIFKTAINATTVLNNFQAGLTRFGPVIGNPSGISTFVNKSATFSVSSCTGTTSGSGSTACTYQWQLSTDGGANYANISGANSLSYTTPALSASANGNRYRVIAYDSGTGSPTSERLFSVSEAALLTVSTPPGSDTDTALTLSAGKYAWASDSNELDITSAITMQAWVYQTGVNSGSWNMVLNKENSYELGTFGSLWYFGLQGSGGWSGVNTGIATRLNEWQHIALTRAAGTNTAKFYLNGQEIWSGAADGASTGNLTNSTQPFTIGGRSSDGVNFSSPFLGNIDEVRVYRSARTQAEIAADMHSYGPINTSNLALYYDFNEGSGNTLYNRASGSSISSDLAVIGSPSWSENITPSISQAYTIRTFTRSYLTSSGGWKVPAGVTQVSTVVVAGGGGGGSDEGGGGGGGGFLESTLTSLNSSYLTVQVGQGGLGSYGGDELTKGANGQNSVFSSLTAIGGGGGGSSVNTTSTLRNGSSGGSGGGGAGESFTNRLGGSGTSGQGFEGGAGGAASSTARGGGGGGAGQAGIVGGAGGAGKASTITGTSVVYAGGGGGGHGNSSSGTGAAGGTGGGGTGGDYNSVNTRGTANTGGGGGGGCGNLACGDWNAPYSGASGGSGIIIIRWITASAPTFTTPASIDTTTALTRYTFRTSGSATSPLIRNFQWQYSTDTGTTWTTVQASTSDSYTTGLLDLGTTGPRYRYRVIVTDSDTAGLSISDSSTSYLVLNRYPTISPPSSNDAGLLVHLDASQAASYSGSGSTWNDISGGGRNASLGFSSGGPIAAGYGSGVTCSAPTYSLSNGGIFTFAGNAASLPRNCAWISGSSFANVGETYTVEMWVNPASSTQAAFSSLISTPWNINDKINFAIAFNGTTTTAGVPDIWGGVFDGTNWFMTPTTGIAVNSWSHVVLTSANRTLTLYVNGESRQLKELNSAPGGAGKGVLIGRRWDGNDTINGSIGTVRISNTALTSEQIRQNYYLSSNRFSNSASGVKSSSTTYAVTLTETFTATNGTGTKRFTFTPNNRAGIVWDTSTANSAVLRVTNQLNAGTYYETMTATDSATAATSLGLTITVNKARQASLSIGQYNAFVGVSTYPINVYGGSGTGAVTRSRLSAGSANCTLTSGMFLTATSSGNCSVQAVKAGDTNYLSETATATIYWIQWSDAYATRAPSTPTEIVLNHSTAITKYNYDTLTVTSYQNSSGVTITSIATGATLRIIGDGFDPTSAYTEVVFASMDALDLTSGLQVISSGGSNYLQLTVPSGVTTGAITVNSPKGTAVGPTLTITP